jgi:hypothetical protein
MTIETHKPKCKLSESDGNIFALMGKATRALKDAGMRDQASALTKEVFACGSYDEALQTVMKYVEVE